MEEMKQSDELRCKCGGKPVWADEGPMIDRLACPDCGLSTHSYFDGREYAEHDWRFRLERLVALSEPQP